MQQYLTLLKHVLENGVTQNDRTNVGTVSVFGYQMRFNLQEGFPLITTKKLHIPSIVHELLWFLAGSTNIQYLQENNIRIWDEWANKNGDLGPIYGAQWRSWPDYGGCVIDQISQVIKNIQKDPSSRRHIVNAWNVALIDKMALPPCHILFQFYVYNSTLSCQLYQRSADLFLGVPFNIASYALLTTLIAKVCNLQVGDFIHTFGDVHIYSNHIEQVKLQLIRDPRPLPSLKLKMKNSIYEYTYDDIQFENYDSYPHIKATVAV